MGLFSQALSPGVGGIPVSFPLFVTKSNHGSRIFKTVPLAATLNSSSTPLPLLHWSPCCYFNSHGIATFEIFARLPSHRGQQRSLDVYTGRASAHLSACFPSGRTSLTPSALSKITSVAHKYHFRHKTNILKVQIRKHFFDRRIF